MPVRRTPTILMANSPNGGRRALRQAHYEAAVKEYRPGVVRKTIEIPTELYLRMKEAAQARGIFTATLWRAVAISWLQEHATLPAEANPLGTGLALAAARSPRNSKGVEAALGPRDPNIAKIFGFDAPKAIES